MRALLLAVVFASAVVRCRGEDNSVLVDYIFREETCKQNHILILSENDKALHLQRNTLLTTCLPAMGIRHNTSPTIMLSSTTNSSKSLYSDSFVQNFIHNNQSVDHHGVYISFWIKFLQSSTPEKQMPIFTIGGNNTKNQPLLSSINHCDAHNVDLQLIQQHESLILYMRTSSIFLEQCQRVVISNKTDDGSTLMQTNTMHHLSVFLSQNKQQILINGNIVATVGGDLDMKFRHWSESSVLQFFDHASFKASWPGIIYRFTVHTTNDFSMSTEQFCHNLIATGLPPSAPYAQNYLVSINEDAESVAASHDAAWYRQSPTVNEVSPIAVRIGSVEREVADLQARVFGNSSFKTDLATPTYVYYMSDTSSGSVYTYGQYSLLRSDTNILQELTPNADSNDYGIVYVPPLNAYNKLLGSHNVFTTIAYCVSSEPLYLASQCPSIGHIGVRIDPVNDPPVAAVNLTLYVEEGIDSLGNPSIQLTGTDVDFDDYITMIEVVQQPMYGYLLLHVGSRRDDNINDSTPLVELNNTVSSRDDVYVRYLWDPTHYAGTLSITPTYDYFVYRIADSSGAWSLPEVAHVHVSSALYISETELCRLDEDQVSHQVVWHFNDKSGYARSTAVMIESSPAESMGVVKLYKENRALKDGDLIALGPSDIGRYNLSIAFHPARNFCNDNTSTTTIMNFRFVAYSSDNTTIQSTSASATQSFYVNCLVDSLTVSQPTVKPLVYTSEWQHVNTEGCHGISLNETQTRITKSCESVAIVEGVTVSTIDKHNGNVTVVLQSQYGYMTIPSNKWNTTQLILGRQLHSFQKTVFSASIDSINDTLSLIYYESVRPVNDTLQLAFLYGDCDDSYDNVTELHSSSRCQVVHRAVNISIAENEFMKRSKERFLAGFPWQMIVCFIGYPILYLGYCINKEIIFQSDDDDDSDSDDTAGEAERQWIQHLSPNGRFYYEHIESGKVAWKAPVGQSFVPYED